MKKSLLFTRPILIGLIMLFSSGWALGQTTTINFEVEGEGYTPSDTEGSSYVDVFNRISSTVGGNNSFIWAVEDLNTVVDPSITLDQIDITGGTSFTFSIDMLAHHYNDWDNGDELLITYSIDGGESQDLLWVQSITDPSSDYNEPAALDTNFDGDGECDYVLPSITTGTGTLGCVVSSSVFETFTTSSISLSGNSTLDIELQFNGFESGDEGIYLDDLVIELTSPTPTTDLIISEYSEGSSYNKYIEIYNGTGATVDLSDYEVWLVYNGGAWSESTITFTGTSIADGDVYVIANSNATVSPTILAEADQLSGSLSFNGDDAVGLAKDIGGTLTLIDVVGAIVDPGSGWEVAGESLATVNNTLVRKETICSPNTDWDNSRGTNATDSEWIVYPEDTWTYIGSHTTDCSAAPVNVTPAISNITQTPSGDPLSTETVSVSADITDADGTIATATLNWGTSSGSLGTGIAMSVSSGDTYTVDTEIPAQADGTTVYYAIVAVDDESGTSTSSESSYTVTDPASTTLPYTESFGANLGDCLPYSVSGATKEWQWDDDGYASMNGYGSSVLEEDWLILPSIDFDNYNLEFMIFDSWFSYGTYDADNYLKLMYSTDYSGLGDPSTAVWTELSFTRGQFKKWTSSGMINLSSLSGTSVYIAFKYHYNSGSYRSWAIDNISISELEEELEAPTYTTNLVDGALNVSLNKTIKFTFNEPIQNVGGAEITNANVATLLTFKKNDASGDNVYFEATIDDTKTVITLIPSVPTPTKSSTDEPASTPLTLDLDQVYYVAIASVEDTWANASTAGDLSFTTPWWTLGFETSGGYTTSAPEFSDGWEDYFTRTDGTNIGGDVEYSNELGAYYFGAQDMDGEGGSIPQELNINDIDITDMRATIFSVYLAEDDDGSNQDWDDSDYVKFQYRVNDDETFTDLIWIAGSGGNTAPSVDANFNGVGDGHTVLTDEFTNLFADLEVKGTTLDIKVIFNLNSGDEDIAIDNISFYAVEGIDPVITSVHEDVNVLTDENCEAMLPDFTGDVVATDNSELPLTITQTPVAGTVIFGGGNLVTLTVTDAAGNTAMVNFKVNADATAPVITSTHPDRTVDAAEGCQAILPDYRSELIATDHCDAELTVGQSHLPGKVIFGDKNAVTLTVFDDAGNSTFVTFNVRVVDNTAPVITSTHSDQVVDAADQCEGILPDYTASVTATDNCDSYVDVTQSPAAGIAISHTTNTVTLTVTDDDGNSSEVSFNVAVEDNTAPTITCIGNQSVLADEFSTFTISDNSFNPAIADNCGVASLVNDFNNTSTLNGEVFQEGTTTVTWTATDYEGNVSTCSFDIIVGEVLNIGSLEANGISVYPNPTNAKINFEFEISKTREIRISDLSGRTILMKIVADRTETIDLSSFDSGIYIISIQDADKTITTRIVKH